VTTRHFSVRLPADAARAFAWHAQPGALARLLPPWDRVQVHSRAGSLRDGRVVLKLRQGPVTLTWDARHDPAGFIDGTQFADTQASGPFAYWHHQHRLEPEPDGRTSVLHDTVTYRLPLEPLSSPARPVVDRMLRRMFAYRHWVTAADLARHQAVPAPDRRTKSDGYERTKSDGYERTEPDDYAMGATMRIAVTGSSGLVGNALVPFLQGGGHEVIRLTRGTPRAPGEHHWTPDAGIVDVDALGPLDAVIHLAGENIAGGRWTPAMKAKIRNSRVGPTAALARSLAAAQVRPKVLVSASAIGYYGDRGTETLTEQSRPGTGFLPETCQAWEADADPARAAGIRVVHPRFGIILDARGGALGKMRLPFSLGLGGPIGSGTQDYSWVGIEDVLGALLFSLTHDTLDGPINVTSPNPVTNAEFTRTLGRVLRRPAIIPVPAFALRAVFGELADAELLSSKRVLPVALEQAGFTFLQPSLEDALRFTLGRVEAAPVG
jgi:uncharacterized protein (TIGR01777 family)